jgi:hypothetical protein
VEVKLDFVSTITVYQPNIGVLKLPSIKSNTTLPGHYNPFCFVIHRPFPSHFHSHAQSQDVLTLSSEVLRSFGPSPMPGPRAHISKADDLIASYMINSSPFHPARTNLHSLLIIRRFSLTPHKARILSRIYPSPIPPPFSLTSSPRAYEIEPQLTYLSMKLMSESTSRNRAGNFESEAVYKTRTPIYSTMPKAQTHPWKSSHQ